jgi:hypothetical protein
MISVVKSRSSATICDVLDRDGCLKIGHGVVRGRRKIRLVCANPDLGERDIARIFQDIKGVAATLPEADNAVQPA